MRDEVDNDDQETTTSLTLPRRGLVAGAVALTAALVLDQAEPVAAADPNDVVKGVLNTTTTTTIISNTTPTSATALRVLADSASNGTGLDASGTSYGVYAVGGQYAGVHGDTSGPNSAGVTGLSRATSGKNYGVTAHTSSPEGYGVYATAGDSFNGYGTAVFGNSGNFSVEPPPGPIGVFGSADTATGLGGVFAGGLAALRLMPSPDAGAPATGTHDIGELVVSSDGRLFLCAAAGTPGTWVRLQTAPTLSILPTPDRFVDTRSGLGGVQGPIAAQSTNTFSMTGRNGESANPALQIPDAATSIVGNLTVIGAAGILLGSFVTLWPGGDRPTVSNINFGPSNATGAVANSFVVGMTDAGGGRSGINVFNNAACDYILDVTGYYI